MDYLSVENQKALDQRYKTGVILVFVFCVTVLIYLLIARFINPGEPLPSAETWKRPVFAGVIVLGLIVVILRRVLMSQIVMRQATLRGVEAVLSKLLTTTIICLVVAEVVAILGLFFYFFTGDYQYSWRLGVVSILLILYSFPRRGEWKRAVITSAKEREGERVSG